MDSEKEDRKALYEAEALAAIKKNKLYTVEQVPAFVSFGKTTFYLYSLNESNDIKEALFNNKIQAKQSLLSNWGKPKSSPALQISAYKLMANEDELRRLNNKPPEDKKEEKQSKAIKLPSYYATPAQQEIESHIETGNYKTITIRKGRRFGFTHWACIYFPYKLYEGTYTKMLWGDTIVSNINRYFDRYMKPTLDKLCKGRYHFQRVERTLTIQNLDGGESIIDFRSADRPENWEGFGYDVIVLNEAGIILNDPYLYKNAVAPMLLDNPNSLLIAGGVPKGRTNKKGQPHTFLELHQKAEKDSNGLALTYSSYDNVMLRSEDIDKLIEDLGGEDSPIVKQEIYGQFVDDFELIFLDRFSEENISDKASFNAGLELHLSFDFNITNTCTVWQFDGTNIMCINEYHIEGYDLQELCYAIKGDYPQSNLTIYGDASGKGRSALTKGNANAYQLIQDYLDLMPNDFSNGIAGVNPTHKASRIFCNAVIKQTAYPILINPKCEGLIRDCKQVRFESKGGKMQIVKSDESLTHHLDTMRYYLHQEHYWLMSELGLKDVIE